MPRVAVIVHIPKPLVRAAWFSKPVMWTLLGCHKMKVKDVCS